MFVFFPSSPRTNGTRIALATNARVRAVHARKLLGRAPYGPDLTTVLEGDLSQGNRAANEELK